MAQVLVIGSIVRPVFLALLSHFLCTPCLLQIMLLIFLANGPPVICQLLDAQLALNLIPVFVSCKPVPPPTQLTKGSATWSSHTVHISHISNWFYGQSEMLLVLLHLVDTSDCSWYLQLAVFAGCLYATSWFALCSNGYVTSHPTCFSRGEQWQPVVNTKATHLHHSAQTLSESISTWQWQWCSQNTSPYTFPKCTMHYITFTLHYVMLRYVTLRYVAWSSFSLLRSVMMCLVAACNLFLSWVGVVWPLNISCIWRWQNRWRALARVFFMNCWLC